MRFLLVTVAWVLGSLGAGCTGSHVGNPSELTLSLAGFDGVDPNGLTLSTGIVVDEAWLVLDRVRLRSAADCSRRDETTDVPAPLVAELVTSRMLPGRPELAAAATRYCRMELRFGVLAEGELVDAPAELVDRSVMVRGARGDAVPFELATDAHDSFRLDAEDDPFALPEGAAGLVVGFAMNEWLQAAALADAEVGTRDGAPFITIDARENATLHAAFRDAVRASANLFRDENRDGRLDASERAVVLGRGVPE